MRLEGSLVGPWVEEVLRVIEGLPTGALTVDLAALAYADREGERLLRDLAARAELRGCSPFIFNRTHLCDSVSLRLSQLPQHS